MLRPTIFSKFGNFFQIFQIWPAALAPCQHSRSVLKESHGRPTTFAKYSWYAAKSTPPDPNRSQLTPHLTSMTYIGPEKSTFSWIIDLDL